MILKVKMGWPATDARREREKVKREDGGRSSRRSTSEPRNETRGTSRERKKERDVPRERERETRERDTRARRGSCVPNRGPRTRPRERVQPPPEGVARKREKVRVSDQWSLTQTLWAIAWETDTGICEWSQTVGTNTQRTTVYTTNCENRYLYVYIWRMKE